MKLSILRCISFIFCFLLISAIPLVTVGGEEPVDFSNRDLELEIREEIGKAVGEI